MSSSNKYSLEVRERTVRMVLEHQSAHDSQWAAVGSIAEKIGCTSETLRKWVRQAERDQGRRPGLTSAERERLKALERENPREVLVDESVEGGLLREVTLVRACVTVESKSRAGGHRSCAVMGVVFTMRSGSGAVIENAVPCGAGHGLTIQTLLYRRRHPAE